MGARQHLKAPNSSECPSSRLRDIRCSQRRHEAACIRARIRSRKPADGSPAGSSERTRPARIITQPAQVKPHCLFCPRLTKLKCLVKVVHGACPNVSTRLSPPSASDGANTPCGTRWECTRRRYHTRIPRHRGRALRYASSAPTKGDPKHPRTLQPARTHREGIPYTEKRHI